MLMATPNKTCSRFTDLATGSEGLLFFLSPEYKLSLIHKEAAITDVSINNHNIWNLSNA